MPSLYDRIKYLYSRKGLRPLFREGYNYLLWWLDNNSVYYNKYLTCVHNLKYTGIDTNPLDVVYVSPKSITHVAGELTSREPGSYHLQNQSLGRKVDLYPGILLDGDWDKNNDKFRDLCEYHLIFQRFVENKSWEDTDFFNMHNDRIKKGINGEWTRNKLLRKFHRYDRLYNDIKKNGYKSQDHLGGRITNEITVFMGRDKELYAWKGGRHRLSIAKVLGIKKVPVFILARHKNLVWPEAN